MLDFKRKIQDGCVMKIYAKKRQGENSVNITSLIDVVFMLVIFFMIGSSFDKAAIPVMLPSSTSASESASIENLSVTIDENENIYFCDKKISIEEVAEETKRTIPSLKEKNAILYSDEKVTLSKIVSIMDELNKGGIENVAIKTHSKS